MKVGVISLAGPNGGELTIAGQPIAFRQSQTAIESGCEVILAVAEAPSPALAAVQRYTEARNVSFCTVARTSAIAQVVRPTDDLLVFAPGIVAAERCLIELFAVGPAIVVVSADEGVALGYERIDRDLAWGGALLVSAEAADLLSDLPAGADPSSALLRAALQKGAPTVSLPPDALRGGDWALVSDEADARHVEAGWLDRAAALPSWTAPSDRLAHRAAQALVLKGGAATGWVKGLTAAGVAGVLFAGAAGFSGRTILALVTMMVAGVVWATGAAAGRLARTAVPTHASRWVERARVPAVDLALLASAASPASFGGWEAAFAAGVLISAQRLGEEKNALLPLCLLADRSLVLVPLAALAAVDRFAGGVAIIASAALALRVLWPVGAANDGLTTAR